jgi:hypothetical protein
MGFDEAVRRLVASLRSAEPADRSGRSDTPARD